MLSVFTNTSALNINRALMNSNQALESIFKRLSSGYRINSASDDAAGLQISSRLTSQINGLDQATRNAQDAISVSQVADGAIGEVTNLVQRMRQLAIQAQNGIYTDNDRLALDKEFQALKQEIDRVANTTTFAGNTLTRGDYEGNFLVGANGDSDEYITITDLDIRSQRLGFYGWTTRENFTGFSTQFDNPNKSNTGFIKQQALLGPGGSINGVTIPNGLDFNGFVNFVQSLPGADITVDGPVKLRSNINTTNPANIPDFITINGTEIRFDDIVPHDPLSAQPENEYYYFEVKSRIQSGLPANVSANFNDSTRIVAFTGPDENTLTINGTGLMMPSITDGAYIPSTFITTDTAFSVSMAGNTPLRFNGIAKDNNLEGLISSTNPLTINGVDFTDNFTSSAQLINAINSADYPANNSPVTATALNSVSFRTSFLPSELSNAVNFSINGQDINLTSIQEYNPLIHPQEEATYYRTNVINQLNTQLSGSGVSAQLSLGGNALSLSLVSSGDITISGPNAGVFFPELKPGIYIPRIELRSFGDGFTNLEVSSNNASQLGFVLEDRVEAIISKMDISTFESAALSVQSLDVGLSQLGFQQSSIGAIENRLASTIRHLSNTSENVSSARSRIRDADFAKETAELTRLQIVTQAASSLLSQANLRPNQVLSLLTR